MTTNAWLERALGASGAAAFRRQIATGELVGTENLARVLGQSRAPRTYEEFLAVVHPSDRERLVALVSRCLRSGALYAARYRVVAEDGRVLTLDARGEVLRDERGTPVALLGCVQDTGESPLEPERRNHELAARNSYLIRLNQELGELSRSPLWRDGDRRRLFELLTEAGAAALGTARASIWLFGDNHRRIVLEDLFDVVGRTHEQGAVLEEDSNPAYFEALGTDRALEVEDALTDPRTAAFAPGYLVPHGVGALLDVPIRVGGRVSGIFCFEHVGGRRAWLQEEVAFAGSMAAYAALALELSAKRQTEALLLQAQKMESVGHLAGGIAHDFNNLLTTIQGSAEILEADLQAASGDATLAQEILEASARAAALTRQLLAFARKSFVSPKLMEPNVALESCRPLLSRLLGSSVRLEVRAGDACRVSIDPSLLELVFVNLAVNARDAMPDGGQLVIETKAVTLDATIRAHHPQVPPGTYAEIIVSDTGSGMSPEVLEKAFDPFFTTKPTGRGTGLGLSSAYGIVSQAGGYIFAYSEIGHGSTFKIYLPRSEEEEAESLPAESTVPVASSEESILVVEDDARVRRMVERSLTSLGYRVRVAESAEHALELFAENAYQPTMMITDVVMPGLDGTELAEHVRELRPGCLVLFMSGYTESPRIREGLESAELHFLPKPFAKKQLADKVSAMLQNHRLGGGLARDGFGASGEP